MSYDKISVGSKYSKSYKTYITKAGKVISPIHDIDLYDGDCIQVICEIPRFENAKFEISKEKEFNPIVQDEKKGKMRFLANVYPFKGYQANYGAIPQTFEDPKKLDKECNAFGDNDPLDMIEIGTKIKETGDVYSAKILGCLAMIDGGEADWKIVVIDKNDPLADMMEDISDVDKYFPGLLKNIRIFLRDYKKADGKPSNTFAFDGEYQNASFARKVVQMANESYKKLFDSDREAMCMKSFAKGDEMVINDKKEPDSEVPDSVREFFFVKEFK